MYNIGLALLLFIQITAVFFSISCSHVVNEKVAPLARSGTFYSALDAEDGIKPHNWWESFNDPFLNDLIAKAFAGNFRLKQGYARLEQAKALEKEASALSYPSLDSGISASSKRTADGRHDNEIVLDLQISWEVDLWDKLSAAEKAAAYNIDAEYDDLQATALLLSTRIAETYFRLIEQNMQLALLQRQLEVDEKFLKLTKLRFAHSAASVVDIYQQRQELAAVRAQFPMVLEQIAYLDNRLHVLQGKVPSANPMPIADHLPDLPALPKLGISGDLLVKRPDLRSLHKRLVAADYRVAEAVAERLPQIKLGADAGFKGKAFSSESLFLSLFGEALSPIVDWRKRKSVVEKQKAIVSEALYLYTEAYLEAVEEVENALTREREYTNLIKAISEQLKIAKKTVTESRHRYIQGLTDYLPVLTALQDQQFLERDILLRRSQLILARIILSRALGGADLLGMSPSTPLTMMIIQEK